MKEKNRIERRRKREKERGCGKEIERQRTEEKERVCEIEREK